MLGDAAPSPSEIYSAANSTRDFFERLIEKGYRKSVHVIGEHGLSANVAEAFRALRDQPQIKVLCGDDGAFDAAADAAVGYVIVGSVFAESTRAVERAAGFIERGARLVHTCPDLFDRRSDGRFVFGMPKVTVGLLEKVLGVKSYNLGFSNSVFK